MFLAKYDAVDIAEYVLWYCENELKKPITNLILQKMLYYVQGYYFKKYNEPIFDNTIEAWQYGPVVPDVYFIYKDNRKEDIKGITMKDEKIISKEDKIFLNNLLQQLIKIKPWALVRKTHSESPWEKNFIPGMNVEIPISDIEECFCN